MNATVSILAEIPEDLHESLRNYLETHPDWDQDRVFSAALSLFLLQNGTSTSLDANRNYRRTARVYLDALFTSSEMYSNILLKLYCKHALVTAIAVNLKKITAGDL